MRNLDRLMELFCVGEVNKSARSTKTNDWSSRSHTILNITIEKKTFMSAQDDVVEDKENNDLACIHIKVSNFV